MDESEDEIEALEARLARHPAPRDPVQHAALQFHLGVALTNAGRLEEAQAALSAATSLFDSQRMPVEHAKASNALGAALRLAKRRDEASDAFRRAARLFEESQLDAECGAAMFNLGLAQRDGGQLDEAAASFDSALSLLGPSAGSARAAATRELGAALFAQGNLEAARERLEEAVALTRRLGDQPGLGAAANALGLVHLAAGRIPDATEAFGAALGAHPRSVRPAEYAMVKANLALAHERTGDPPRARIAARQALAVRLAPEPVRQQAADLLERVGGDPGDLVLVLEAQPRETWSSAVREELARWADADAEERRAEACAWIEGQLDRPGLATDLAEALLAGLLELPAQPMQELIAVIVGAAAQRSTEEQARLRADVSMAMARFHAPQWMRLRDTFNRSAGEVGIEAGWG
jgi:tetratricopeptide (TPR) repeat protein